MFQKPNIFFQNTKLKCFKSTDIFFRTYDEKFQNNKNNLFTERFIKKNQGTRTEVLA